MTGMNGFDGESVESAEIDRLRALLAEAEKNCEGAQEQCAEWQRGFQELEARCERLERALGEIINVAGDRVYQYSMFKEIAQDALKGDEPQG